MNRAGRPTNLPELSRLEQEVMNVVWESGECGSAEVIEAYNAMLQSRGQRTLAKTTIRTVLANLRKKGYVEPVPSIERGFRLKALVTRESVARRSIKALVSGLFKGSPRQAIAYLLKDEAIDERDLEEIRRLLEERKKGRVEQ